MKIKIESGSPIVSVEGLGLIETNTWIDITERQREAFERIHNRSIQESFATKKDTKSKKETN